MTKVTAIFLGLFFSAMLLAKTEPVAQKRFRTYVSIEKVTDETSIDLTVPQSKAVQVTQTGKRYEIPWTAAKENRFKVVVQMKNKRASMLPCEIYVEQLNDYDRSYICHTTEGTSTAVHVRVFTNLHGGDKFRATQVLARK